jgi:glyoxylase-like metal-dependent hydrolase (beta-lactamase superfamily II)
MVAFCLIAAFVRPSWQHVAVIWAVFFAYSRAIGRIISLIVDGMPSPMSHCGGLLTDGVKERLRPDLQVHVAAAEAEFWEAPDFSRVSMPPGFPDALRRTGKRFLKEFHSQLRTFENEYEVAPGVVVQRTGGHTPGHSVVRLASGGDRLTFAGDLVFQVGFEHPDWYNGFEHDPEEAARVRVRLLRELAANRESLVATHLSFPSVCHVAVNGDVFRWVPGPWEY